MESDGVFINFCGVGESFMVKGKNVLSAILANPKSLN